MPAHPVRRSCLALLASLAVAAATAPAGASGQAPAHATAQYEIRFMTGMADHHLMALHMAELCLTNATHEELQVLCGEIIAAQDLEIIMMQSWLQSWYGVTYSPQMKPGMERQMERMAQLTGAELEIAFMKSMIRHHWTAVVRASACVDQADHPELVSLCANIVETQVAEITQMRTWLCDWFAICNYGPKGAVAQAH